jgi:hypothetical protein
MGANAQIAVPAFTAGQILTAAQQTQINTGIPVFATTTTRDAAFGGAGEKTLAEGQFAYLEDTNTTQYYDGAAWVAVGGKVGQVLSATKTDTFTMASTTYADVTGLSVSITPSSATSKILVMAQVSAMGTVNGALGYGQFVRGSTAIGIGDASGSRVQSTFGIPFGSNTNALFTQSPMFLDSPATTSATTYKMQIRSENTNTIFVNRSESDSNNVASARSISTITVMEIL